MSYVYTTIAWKAPLRTAVKFVLVSLADQANDDGICWPSVAKLCDRVAMTDRGVQRVLSDLVDQGYLVRHMRPGRSTYYQLQTPDSRSDAQSNTSDSGSGSPQTTGRITPDSGSPITIKELSVEPSIGRSSPAEPKKRKPRKSDLTLREWIAGQPKDAELIGPDHPSRKFAREAGIPDGWVALAFRAFTDKHLASDKRYKDWGAAFRNAVAGNWEKVWFMHEDGQWRLTTVGHGLDRVVNGGGQ